MREGQVEAHVKACRVVDLGVPAAQQEGEDGQTEEEEADDHAHPVQPLQEGIGRRRLRMTAFICTYYCLDWSDVETGLLSKQCHSLARHMGLFQGVIFAKSSEGLERRGQNLENFCPLSSVVCPIQATQRDLLLYVMPATDWCERWLHTIITRR